MKVDTNILRADEYQYLFKVELSQDYPDGVSYYHDDFIVTAKDFDEAIKKLKKARSLEKENVRILKVEEVSNNKIIS
jgi:hypothetical protein